MKSKFVFDEVVRINPEGGILDITDICNLGDLSPLWKSGIREQQDLVGKMGIIVSMVHANEEGDEIDSKYDGEWFYGVSIDVVNPDEVEFDELTFSFRETDLESTGVIRENPETEPREVIRVRVDPETGEGYIVEADD